ncbi:Aliphatic sulfonates import ATP-binding protein SsuB (plasmid) [Hartmannibacter diazotrophicus]|uniref:Aliphatic sulfonates import ATP-binding protein SsuB n=1 Tax=Hartmannibacter diazotrophicus TaxID=1482074 RepID=A0A2C9DDM7_9HYPH|nr:ABC transporter ATP-binding protein [Hartmannibacter diazotrophicus]SON58414.1 Aliphatic sulfonates import ATP-binding protein SsuB [Hartmannibacter diazotrophicus]
MTVVETQTRGEVTIRDLSKTFAINGETLTVLKGINLDISGGESIAIVGASGSGKTTLLRVLAGLEEPDDGGVLIDGAPVHGLGRDRSVIFQEPRLLPWLTVLGNVAFALEVQGVPAHEAKERARRYIRLVGLGEFESAWPRQLSGGMAQRVGIARALTVQPEILLLDEPLGALDAMTKITMQEELSRIWAEEEVTMVLVTHDLEEAIFLADRVLVLPKTKGAAIRLIDIDLPRPRDRNEARFVTFRQQLMAEFGLH